MVVYVIVVTYNGMKWIDRCLGSLRNSSILLKTIVIDNQSTDGTCDFIRDNYKEIELIVATSNLGFGKANNIGLRKALKENADFVFLLNQDAWILEDTIKKLLNVAYENTLYGILSPIHLNRQENSLEKQFQYFLNESNTNGFVSDSYLGNFKSIYSTSFVSAAAWLLPIRAVKKIGLFDPLYFHYGEDDDYIHRARYHGFKIGIVPSAKIVHDAVFKTWEMLEFNFARRNTIDIVKLKDINYSFRSNFNVYLKSSIDELTTHLLFRQWKKMFFKMRLLWKLVLAVRKVNRSYYDSKKEGAFI